MIKFFEIENNHSEAALIEKIKVLFFLFSKEF